MKKKQLMLLLSLLILIVLLVSIFLLGKPWLTKEEKILNQIMGAYAEEEYIGSYYDLKSLDPPTAPYKLNSLVPHYWIHPDSFGVGGEEEDYYYYNYLENKTTTYSLKEIDEEFYNTVDALTVTLKSFLIPDLKALSKYKDKYLFQVYHGKDGALPNIFFYLDGTLYTSGKVFKLKKIEDAEHPLSIKKGGFPKDSILNELDGKTYFCEYFDVYDPAYKANTVSFDKTLVENKTVTKRTQYVVFGSNKYMERYDDIYNNSLGILRSWIFDNPNYEVVEIDEEFYNNGIDLQGFALHRLIDSVEELKSYKEKYAIIMNKPEAVRYGPESIVYFYLDGKLYSSPDYRLPYDTIFPMEEMKGEGITR